MWEVWVFVVWEVGESIHLKDYLGEKGIFLLVCVWLLVLSLGE